MFEALPAPDGRSSFFGARVCSSDAFQRAKKERMVSRPLVKKLPIATSSDHPSHP